MPATRARTRELDGSGPAACRWIRDGDTSVGRHADRLRRDPSLSESGGRTMPEKRTIERARRAKRAGKRPSTQAGEFVREEIHHVREGKHGARSTKQAIAIGLSKARRAGVKMPSPPPSASKRTRES